MELLLDGKNYRIGKMGVFTQLHVSRRLTPALLSFAAGGIGSIAVAMQSMSDTDTDYIVNSCMAACSRQEGDKWQAVQVKPGVMQYEDITLDIMIRLTVEVIKDNLGNFLNGLLEASDTGQQE